MKELRTSMKTVRGDMVFTKLLLTGNMGDWGQLTGGWSQAAVSGKLEMCILVILVTTQVSSCDCYIGDISNMTTICFIENENWTDKEL